MTNNQITTLTILVLATMTSSLVSSQFLQPQSHLGRLVQSITSPLVLSSSAYTGGVGPENDEYPASDPSSSYYSPDTVGQLEQHQPPQQQQSEPHHQQGSLMGERQVRQQYQGLQQAPSQQRGVPKRYHNQESDNEDRDGIAPSNSKQSEEYQMGAYLGPTIDDKELNQAFNGNNDERDDDDMAGYDNQQSSPRKVASSSQNGYAREGDYERGSNGPSDHYGQGYSSNSAAGSGRSSAYDDDEDAPRPNNQQRQRAGAYRGGSLNQAASQYQQQHQGNPNNNMVAAANGYAPYNYAGPIDLGSILAGANPNGFQVYNGDGSYPGAGNPNYGYQQQSPRQRGSRNQAESMNNYGYYNNNNNGYGQPIPGRQQQANDDNEQDNDADED